MILCLLSEAQAGVVDAKVIAVRGTVTSAANEAEQAKEVELGGRLAVGSTIETAVKSELLMSPFPSSAVRVLESNRVILEEAYLEKSGETILGRKAKLNLRRGTVEVGLDRLKEGSTTQFEISTPHCVAAARGTIFSVLTNVVGKFDETVTIVESSIVDVRYVDDEGVLRTFAVPPGHKFTVRRGKHGLVHIGPVLATEAELWRLRRFVERAIDLGLLNLPPIGELEQPESTVSFPALNELDDIPVLPVSSR